MIDREKVIKDLECCSSSKFPSCDECDRYGDVTYDNLWSCRSALMREVLELLKAQEPVEQEPVEATILYYRWNAWYLVCGACYREVDKGDAYCRWCGRKLQGYRQREVKSDD